jgi:type I restriction enzyme M protein
MANNFGEKVSFIWSVADLLRGPYRPNQYTDVMLPMTVLRRLDCVLEPTKEKVLAKYKELQSGKIKNLDPILNKAAGQSFHNVSRFTFEKLKGDPNHIADNLKNYIKGFSANARDILDHFGFEEHIDKLDKADRLFHVVQKFCEIDLHPDVVPNIEMGTIFEELIRRFNEASNEEAGDHFTPREVIRLMVDLLFLPDDDVLRKPGIIRTLFDPACGTGGMLSIAEEYLRELNPEARLEVFGQDYNDQAYAVCGSDMMIKGQDPGNVRFGNSFTQDHFDGRRFDYMLANPPFGVEWKPEEDFVTREREEKGFGGRFGAGLPRINDGAFLFLQHMISKRKDPKEGGASAKAGTRLAIVFNGSPLFTGGAGSGESEIRRWIIENDWLEAVVALPDQLFYNTGISTYLWIVTNRKERPRRGKIQLVDATGFFKKMRKSLGNKRNEIGEEQREEITRLYGEFKAGEHVRIFDNPDFGYKRITVERPLRLNFAVTEERLARLRESGPFQSLAESRKRKDAKGAEAEIAEGKKIQSAVLKALARLEAKGPVKDREKFIDMLKKALQEAKAAVSTPLFKAILDALSERDETAQVCMNAEGKPEPDADLRDNENVPLKEDVATYMKREVLPHVPDAWVDEEKTKVGYEINFNRYFYKYTPPRPLETIESELKKIEGEIAEMLGEMAQ